MHHVHHFLPVLDHCSLLFLGARLFQSGNFPLPVLLLEIGFFEGPLFSAFIMDSSLFVMKLGIKEKMINMNFIAVDTSQLNTATIVLRYITLLPVQ